MSIDFPNMTNGISEKEAIIFRQMMNFLVVRLKQLVRMQFIQMSARLTLACSMKTLFIVQNIVDDSMAVNDSTSSVSL